MPGSAETWSFILSETTVKALPIVKTEAFSTNIWPGRTRTHPAAPCILFRPSPLPGAMHFHGYGKRRMTDILDSLVDVRILASRTLECAWLPGSTFKIPLYALERFSRDIARAVHLDEITASLNLTQTAMGTKQEIADLLTSLRTIRMFTDEVPLSSRLPISYQLIPPFIRSLIARVIGRRKWRDIRNWAYFPGFPLDLTVDILSDIFGVPYDRLKPTPVLLTHDIDSLEGLKKLPMFIKEEESVGARSTNFVVPCSWPLDHDILSGLAASGHEIGIHGFDHSNTTAFLNEPVIAKRIDKMQDLIGRYKITGYRAPSLLRTRKLLRELSRAFTYDSSIPTSGGLFPIPNNGCASARHFMVEGIHEIPLSMPRDGSLLFLGYQPNEIKDIWLTCADKISSSGGVIVLLTHCEKRFSGNDRMLGVYRDLLQYFKSDENFTFMTCTDFIHTILHRSER